MLTFAIGDIHGCLDNLNMVLDACEKYAGTKPHRFVFIGDYVDRGPDSKGVIDRILALRAGGADVVTLMGNHEQMMLGALHHRDQGFMEMFLQFGGRKTLESYGTDAEFKEAFAGHIADFFPRLHLFYDDGLRFFVHAGVDHAKPLETQSDYVMLWGNGSANPDVDPGRYVVHGHIETPVSVPQRHHINIDTGAYAGGPLTCAVLDDKQRAPIALICDDLLTRRA